MNFFEFKAVSYVLIVFLFQLSSLVGLTSVPMLEELFADNNDLVYICMNSLSV